MIHDNIPEIKDSSITNPLVDRLLPRIQEENSNVRSVIFENSKVFLDRRLTEDSRYVEHEGPRHRERSKSRSGAARGAEVEVQGGELTPCLEIPSRCRARQPTLPKRNEAVIVIHQRIFNSLPFLPFLSFPPTPHLDS